MDNFEEAKNRFESAEHAISVMNKIYQVKELPVAVHYAQVAIEQSAKTIIAFFNIPEWEHNVSNQLLKVLEEHREEIIEKCGSEIIERIKTLAENNEKTYRWHEWSIYGKTDEITKKWLLPKTICTEEIANWILPIAEESFKTAKEFYEKWQL